MSAPANDEKVSRGAEVAKDLGWPEHEIGFAGAAGSLVNLGAELERPRSSMARVRRYRARSNARTRELVVDKIKRLSR